MSKNLNVKKDSKENDHRGDIGSDEECEFDDLKSESHCDDLTRGLETHG